MTSFRYDCPCYHIFLGNSDPLMNDILLEALEVVKGDFDLNITTLDHLGKLTKAAANRKP